MTHRVAGSTVAWKSLFAVSVVAAVAITAVAPPAAKAQDNKLQKAREHFDRGTAFFRQGKFDEALEELMDAYVLDPNPALVYNIARVHEERGDLSSALKFFQNYLTIAPRRAKRRRAAKNKIRQLKRALKNAPRQGMLAVASDPVGATVRVDGRLLGQTPISGARVAVGRHKLEILRDRYQAYHADIIVQAGRTTTLDIRLVDAPSSVLITTTPPGATATITAPDNLPLGSCPCVANLSSGRYKLRVSLNGYRTREFDFVKQPLERLKVPVTLVPVQTAGQLVVDASVPGAQVIVDGQPVGITPMRQPIGIRLGVVQVEVAAAGHQPWRQAVQVGPNGVTQVRAVLQPAPANVLPVRPVDPNPQVVFRHTDAPGTAQATWGWILTTVGIVGVLGGGASTTVALVDQHKFDNATYFKVNKDPKIGSLIRQDLTQKEVLALQDEAQLLQTISIAAYASGGALLVTGIILLATDSGPEMESLSLLPVPGGAMMTFGATF